MLDLSRNEGFGSPHARQAHGNPPLAWHKPRRHQSPTRHSPPYRADRRRHRRRVQTEQWHMLSGAHNHTRRGKRHRGRIAISKHMSPPTDVGPLRGAMFASSEHPPFETRRGRGPSGQTRSRLPIGGRMPQAAQAPKRASPTADNRQRRTPAHRAQLTSATSPNKGSLLAPTPSARRPPPEANVPDLSGCGRARAPRLAAQRRSGGARGRAGGVAGRPRVREAPPSPARRP